MEITKLFLIALACIFPACSPAANETPLPDNPKDTTYDETGCLYTSYDNLVMAGYQGWFTAMGDGADRGWHHYEKSGRFEPGYTTVDFWPDVSEYSKTYKTAFKYADGSDAYVYSPYDEESVDLHFKWMKDYGIDGVFMQRFVSEIKSAKGRNHFNKVLANALKAAKKYQRAICVMYDLSGCSGSDMQILLNDWNELQKTFSLFDNVANPSYLRHNKKPLVVLWGVGFNDGRNYSLSDVQGVMQKLRGDTKRVSIMLGVPYYWRTLDHDTQNDPLLHTLIKSADIIMPWAVGRYNNSSYPNTSTTTLINDLAWCRTNNVTYVPLVFPGFSWGNLKNDFTIYDQIPRLKGDFIWKQIAGAKAVGVKSLYVAMFDEIDEGTAIFKCSKEGNLPLNASGRFVGIEADLGSDYYLWLVGRGAAWFHGDNSFGVTKPVR
ncbi:MAG TPA: glycoside hydrolase family 71/99-like protein [Bacteroidales bacterium]|nr:glycoside hydrolase family 71/99-like protein [Bacteroidales bacterium]